MIKTTFLILKTTFFIPITTILNLKTTFPIPKTTFFILAISKNDFFYPCKKVKNDTSIFMSFIVMSKVEFA